MAFAVELVQMVDHLAAHLGVLVAPDVLQVEVLPVVELLAVLVFVEAFLFQVEVGLAQVLVVEVDPVAFHVLVVVHWDLVDLAFVQIEGLFLVVLLDLETDLKNALV